MLPLAATRRALSTALLLLHVIVVAGLVPLADARLERAAGDGVVHVESEDSPSCPPGHDHLQCQFCRHLGTKLLDGSATQRVPERAVTYAADPFQHQPVLAAAGFYLPVGSRAPPVV